MLKIGDIVRVRSDAPFRVVGGVARDFRGVECYVWAAYSPNWGRRMYYDCGTETGNPHNMWHVRWGEWELELVNEEAVAYQILGEDYFA